MKTIKTIIWVVTLSVFWAACSDNKSEDKDELALKEIFEEDFLIGTALSADQILEKDTGVTNLVKRHFNALTAENIMKSMHMQPEWGRYDFSLADRLIEYSSQHGMAVIGHTLIWHSQLPRYVQQITDRDSLEQFFSNHILTIAERYDNKIIGWDVVNEALNEDGTMRESVFYRLLGDDYVVRAFELADQAAPNTKLYYNDYNIEQPLKREGTLRLIDEIQEAGVRIDGVGIQGHWHMGKVPLKEIEESIEAYAAKGLEVMITELDIEVLSRNFTGAEISKRMEADSTLNPYTDGLPDDVQLQLANDYKALFELFLKHKDKVSRVTFWGVHDGQSWLNDWPVSGRTNYPLLFDRELKPKPAFYKTAEAKQN